MLKKIIKFFYEDSDYNCPNCGNPSSKCEGNGNYGYICSECGTEFETPDT